MGITIVIAIMLVMSAMLGFLAGGAAQDVNYEAGWEAGVKDGLSILPEEAIRMLAEEDPCDQGMQMMLDS